jgi:hypothetical protein
MGNLNYIRYQSHIKKKAENRVHFIQPNELHQSHPGPCYDVAVRGVQLKVEECQTANNKRKSMGHVAHSSKYSPVTC